MPNSHISWSNIRLKSDKKNSENKKEDEAVTREETPRIEEENINENDAFNFENLIMNLGDMRSKASNLSFDERKKYAEDVVKNFWGPGGGVGVGVRVRGFSV